VHGVNEPYLRFLSHPELEKPVLVEGLPVDLPGFGRIGRTVAELLIEFSHAERFAELYSPSLPDYVIVEKDGICRPPRYEFYASNKVKPHLVILTGDEQPQPEDVTAHYDLCDRILDLAEGYGCRLIVTLGGVPTPRHSGEVYVAATSRELAVGVMEKGAVLYEGGRIIAATGLLLGLARNRGMEGICLLGATSDLEVDREAALSVFKFLTRTLEIGEVRADL